MVTYTDITEKVVSQTNIPVVLGIFRNKARTYSLIRDASLTFFKVEGARLSTEQVVFQAIGEVRVSCMALPELVLKFSASAEYKETDDRVYLTGFKILNGLGPVANKLIETTGIGVGRSLHVSAHDAAVVKEALTLSAASA
jgi:hypothetical protein